MRKGRLAAGVGITLFAALFGVPFVHDDNSASGTVLGLEEFICYGLHAPAGSDPGGTAETGDEHQHKAPAGLYMPMFSTPPIGGAVYNGPPLDEC
jgi:hypothetical protein